MDGFLHVSTTLLIIKLTFIGILLISWDACVHSAFYKSQTISYLTHFSYLQIYKINKSYSIIVVEINDSAQIKRLLRAVKWWNDDIYWLLLRIVDALPPTATVCSVPEEAAYVGDLASVPCKILTVCMSLWRREGSPIIVSTCSSRQTQCW